MNRILLILFVLTSFFGSTEAQVSKSSEYSRSKVFDKTEKYNPAIYKSLLDSADFYLGKNRNKCFDFLEEAYILTTNSRYSNYQYQVLQKLGDFYTFYKQYDLAAINYLSAAEKTNDNSIKPNLINLAAESYVKAGYYRQAIKLFSKYKMKRNSNQTVAMNILLSDAFLGLQKTDSALIVLNIAEKLAQQNKMVEAEIDIQLRKAKILGNQGSTAELPVLKEANAKSKRVANQVYQIETETKLAEYYQKNNMSEQEIVSRNTIINDLEQNRDVLKKEKVDVDGRIAEEKLNLASVYISDNQLNVAFSMLNTLPGDLEKGNDKNSLEIKKEVAKLRSQAYLKAGQKEEALKSYEEYAAILDELYSKSELEYKDITQLNNQLRDHQWRIDFLEKDKQIYDAEIDMIAKEREMQDEKLSYQRTFILLLSGLILLLLAFIIVLIARMRIQKKHNSYLALKSLRTQMNPHFIFNALNSINHFIVKNDERNANKFLGKFAKLMRDILQNSEADFIPLKQEIEMMQHYLELEYMRFPDKFEYDFVIEDNLENTDIEIPPMILQPYIENAVWHGLRYLESGGKLLVKMEKVEKSLRVIIEDNGIGRAKSAALKTKHQLDHKSKGLTNTNGRLKILSQLYGKEIHVEITDLNPDGTGTRVELVLPLMKIES